MPRELQRQRSERRRSPSLLFLKKYWVEILIVVGLILGLFLLFEQVNIRGTMTRSATAFGNFGLDAVTRLKDGLLSLRARLGISELVALPILISVTAVALWRARWRLQHMPSLTTLCCPRCGGSLLRVHRSTSDKVISIFVPVRRYCCANHDCGWSGRRVSTSSGRGRAKPAPQ